MESKTVYSIRDFKKHGIHKVKINYVKGELVRKEIKFGRIYYSNEDIFITYKESFEATMKILNQEKNKIEILKSILIHNSTRRKIKKFIRCKKVRIKESIRYSKYYNDEFLPFRDNIIASNKYEGLDY